MRSEASADVGDDEVPLEIPEAVDLSKQYGKTIHDSGIRERNKVADVGEEVVLGVLCGGV